jgi:sugar (pentulose or hexulose) kinase
VIQFLGLHLGASEAATAVLGRDFEIWAEARSPVMNASEDAAAGITRVPPAEWVRAGAYALQAAYFELPVRARKVWGLGLAGPSGWVALDADQEPLTPVRLADDAAVTADITRWMAADPRAAARARVLLSPKDYFRFAVSGGLAADATSASRLELLADGAVHWSEERAAARGIRLGMLPPVFDSHVPTGRLSEEGIRRTSLPRGLWLVAGTHEDEAALLAAADLRLPRRLVGLASAGAALAAYGIHGLRPVTVPSGWRAVRSPLEGEQLLERRAAAAAWVGSAGALEPGSADPEAVLLARRRELEAAGFIVDSIACVTGRAEVGAALLAAIGSGLLKRWERFWDLASAHGKGSATPGSGAGDASTT